VPVLGGQGAEAQVGNEDDKGQYYNGTGTTEYMPEKRLRDIQTALRNCQDMVYAQKKEIKGLNKELSQVNGENNELRRLLAATPKKRESKKRMLISTRYKTESKQY